MKPHRAAALASRTTWWRTDTRSQWSGDSAGGWATLQHQRRDSQGAA